MSDFTFTVGDAAPSGSSQSGGQARALTSDVALIDTTDGGEIVCVNGIVQMSDGLFNFFYLCLFGGNVNDSGIDNDPSEWWANKDEAIAERKLRSETQFLLRSLPLTSGNLGRLRDAATNDCSSALQVGLVDTLSVRVTIPALNTVKIEVNATINDKAFNYAFTAATRALAEVA
jgi:hypothetical protein